MTKQKMCKKLNWEYLGRGIDSKGNDGFIIRKIGFSEFISIGRTAAEAYDYLKEKIANVQYI